MTEHSVLIAVFCLQDLRNWNNEIWNSVREPPSPGQPNNTASCKFRSPRSPRLGCSRRPRSFVQVSFCCASVIIPAAACDMSPSRLCKLQRALWTLKNILFWANCSIKLLGLRVLVIGAIYIFVINKKLDTSLHHLISSSTSQATSPAVFWFPNIVQPPFEVRIHQYAHYFFAVFQKGHAQLGTKLVAHKFISP